MNGFSKIALAVTGSLVLASTVLAQGAPPTPEQQAQAAVKTRQGLFQVIAFSFGPAGAQLRPGAPAPDAAAIGKAAERLQVLSPLISEVFAKDTHGVAGVTTKARDAIWTSKSDFDAKAADLTKAAADLEAAAKSGDAGAIKKAAGGVGKSCGACHDQFRDK